MMNLHKTERGIRLDANGEMPHMQIGEVHRPTTHFKRGFMVGVLFASVMLGAAGLILWSVLG